MHATNKNKKVRTSNRKFLIKNESFIVNTLEKKRTLCTAAQADTSQASHESSRCSSTGLFRLLLAIKEEIHSGWTP
jgi:hypothetical protein